jgi:hypothetical protein
LGWFGHCYQLYLTIRSIHGKERASVTVSGARAHRLSSVGTGLLRTFSFVQEFLELRSRLPKYTMTVVGVGATFAKSPATSPAVASFVVVGTGASG